VLILKYYGTNVVKLIVKYYILPLRRRLSFKRVEDEANAEMPML
jgi:hypothetical protein